MTVTTLPPDMPTRMRQLRTDSVGRPVPWFVPNVGGQPDFRLMDPNRLVQAIREQLCFICGGRLLRVRGSNAPRGTFVVGPMCVVNRTSAEPPNHAECAEWSAKACPFLTKPAKVRRETNMPDDLAEPAGIMIARNPGVSALVHSERWKVWRPSREMGIGGDGVLFDFDRIEAVQWMAEGRTAHTDEVLASIESGLPALIEVAETEPGAMPMLGRKVRDALRWLPGRPEDMQAEYPTLATALAEQR